MIGLRLVRFSIYAVFAAVTAALLAPGAIRSLVYLLSPVVDAVRPPPSLVWLLLTATWLVLVVRLSHRFVSGAAPGLTDSIAILVLLVGAIGTRQLDALLYVPPGESLAETAGNAQCAYALGVVQIVMERGRTHDAYDQSEIEIRKQFRRESELAQTNFRAHGKQLPFTIELVEPAQGPVVVAGSRLPGTVIVARRADHRRYWLTTVGLAPGGARVLADDQGVAVVLHDDVRVRARLAGHRLAPPKPKPKPTTAPSGPEKADR